KLSYEEQKAQAKVIRKLERAVEDAEKLIEKLETELADIEAKMSTPEGAADMQLCAQYGELKNKVDAAVEQWEKASEELEEAKNV
ncbi:MAG: ABC transporter ATP-binding protein, partial [Bacteroidaceae bacterium]|nr:ABC transporter ATP-binding protein [Bacteroidaceae bacterium]